METRTREKMLHCQFLQDFQIQYLYRSVANKHSPSPLTLAFPPFFPHFLFSFSFSSADVDLEEAGKEGGKSREVMRLNKEGKWSSWHFSVSLCGSLHRLWNIM